MTLPPLLHASFLRMLVVSRLVFYWEAVGSLWPSPPKFVWKGFQKPKMEKLCSLKVSLLIGSLLIVLTELSESSCQKPECILERQSEQLFQQHRLLLWALCIWYRLIHVSGRATLLFWNSWWIHLSSQGCPQIPSVAFGRFRSSFINATASYI